MCVACAKCKCNYHDVRNTTFIVAKVENLNVPKYLVLFWSFRLQFVFSLRFEMNDLIWSRNSLITVVLHSFGKKCVWKSFPLYILLLAKSRRCIWSIVNTVPQYTQSGLNQQGQFGTYKYSQHLIALELKACW